MCELFDLRAIAAPRFDRWRQNPGMARGVLLTEWIVRRGGVAHSKDAREAGFSDRDMAEAVRVGALTRVHRSWLAAAGCDERRIAAAEVSGRLTCVSVAASHGLWVPDHSEVHVAVPRTSSRLQSATARLHWGRGPVPVTRTAIEDPAINALFHIARCLSRRDALMVWESALRKGFVLAEELARVKWGSDRARALAAVASVLSDSGLETAFIDGMRQYKLEIRQQVWIDGHPVDVLIGDRLVIQIDGFGFHSDPARRRKDIRDDARLVLRGYTVLRFDFVQILFEWEHVAKTVLLAIAQGLHRVG